MGKKFRKLVSLTPMLAALVFLLLATALCANLMRGIRTFSRGENLWSKSEKQVQIDLLQFTYTHDPVLLVDAAKHIAVLDADRAVRLQLQSENPNYQILTWQAVRGGNLRQDIPSAIRVYRLFGHARLFTQATTAWQDTDAGVDKLKEFLTELSGLGTDEQSKQRASEIRRQLTGIDSELTKRQLAFSEKMNAASSLAESILLITNVGAGAALMSAAGFASRKVARRLRRSELRDFALRRAKDSLETRVRLRTAELEKEVNDRKQAEAELHWKTVFLEALGDATVDGILVVDRKGDKIYHNQQFLRMWKIPQHITDEKSDKAQLQHVVRLTKEPDKFLEKVLYLYQHPDETSRDEVQLQDGTFLDRYSAPVLGKNGEYFGRIWTFHDITERKRTENALRESEERFRLVVEDGPVGMYIQTDGIFRYINPAAVTMFGAQSKDEIVGQSLLERIHPDSRDAVIERARTVTQRRKSVPLLEEQHLRLDGSAFDTENSAVPFYFEGRRGALVFFRDITDRKNEEKRKADLEQQLRQSQKMEAIGRLAGGVAHDFNNLLMVIQTYAEMLQESFPPEDRFRRNTEQILKAASRGASLTGQMLAFSRKQNISPVVLDLNAVIEDTGKMLARLIGEDIDLRLDAGDCLWKIEADPDQIAQVLMNLCVNARDAMPKGGTLTISTENVTFNCGNMLGIADVPSGDYVWLVVSDTGTGIKKEQLDKIFEPFFTTKEAGKGTGLGLAMVYGIVKQSGGYVWVDSEFGHGACFTICFPRVERALAPKEHANTEHHPRGSETVIVAEDEEQIREAICEFLRSLGYKVFGARSAEEAISLGQQHQIDLLVTDVVMPRMSGRDLSEVMARLHPAIKMIFMSGYTDDAVLRHGAHKLQATLLQKPFSLGTLARKVRDILLHG